MRSWRRATESPAGPVDRSAVSLASGWVQSRSTGAWAAFSRLSLRRLLPGFRGADIGGRPALGSEIAAESGTLLQGAQDGGKTVFKLIELACASTSAVTT